MSLGGPASVDETMDRLTEKHDDLAIVEEPVSQFCERLESPTLLRFFSKFAGEIFTVQRTSTSTRWPIYAAKQRNGRYRVFSIQETKTLTIRTLAEVETATKAISAARLGLY
jgi:hypothetical protein